MRTLVRWLTVLSFASFLVAATLAFSVRVSAAPSLTDGGVDAGVQQIVVSEPQGFSSSKSFGASIAPPGTFNGLGGLRSARSREDGGDAGTVLSSRFSAGVSVEELSVRGALTESQARGTVRGAVGIRFGREPCVTSLSGLRAELTVKANGAVRAMRSTTPDGGVEGLACFERLLTDATFPVAAAPSTISVTLRFHRIDGL